MGSLILSGNIAHLIHSARGQRVILDADLARLYDVPTKRLNEQVKRNQERFPEDFMFQLTEKEASSLPGMRSQFATASKRNVRFLPYAFTEHGALMAANVLNSQRAVQMSVQIVKTFVRLRRMTLSVEALARKMDQMESKYDSRFKVVFKAIRQLMTPPKPPVKPDPPRKRIGFNISGDS